MKAGAANRNGASECRDPGENTRAGTRVRSAGIVAVLLLTVLGIGLRTYRLSDQSVWVDEYHTIVGLEAPDVATYLTTARFLGPENVPLYNAALYFWAVLTRTSSPPVLRLLSVIVSAMCIPMMYLLAGYVYGKKAGLIAGLCLALSPIHIELGRTIRPNAAVELFVLVSVYALIRAAREDKPRWWAINLGANLVLVWLHPFTLFFLSAEACFMLLYLRRRFCRTVTWGVAQGIAALSPMLWLHPALSSVLEAKDDFYMTLPPLSRLVADFIGDDAVMLSDPFAFQGVTWKFLPAHLQEVLVSAHGGFDAALIVFLSVCVLWTGVNVAKSMRYWGGVSKGAAGDGQADAGALLLLVLFLPLTILVVLSLAWRPCILPRYTCYSSLAVYPIVGAAVARLPKAVDQRAAVAILVVLYAYQLSLTLPAPTRTDWLSAARHIKSEASPGDCIVAKGTHETWEVFRFNAVESEIPILPAYTLQAICEKSALFLEDAASALSPTAPGRAMWAVVEPFIYRLPPLDLFETCLVAHGLTYARTDFPGMNGLYVYRIERDPNALPGQQRTSKEISTSFDAPAVLADMGLAHLQNEERQEALTALRRAVDTEFPRTRFYYSLLAVQLAYEGHSVLAEAAARKAASLDPDYPFGHFVLAIALGEQGDASGAQAAFQSALDLDATDFYPLYQKLFRAVYVERDYEEARAHIARMDTIGMFLPHVVRARAGQLRIPQSLKPRP